MSTSFPGALDDFTNPSGSQSLAAGGHSQLHADLNDAVEALEAKVGADLSAVTTSHDYLLAQLAGNLLLGAGEISVTGETTATIGRMHVCSGTAADYNVFLPTPAGNAGKLIGFRMSPLLTKFVTLIGTGEPGTGTGSIDHAASRTMWTSEAAILYCDGADWFKVAGKTIPMQCTLRRSTNQSNVVTATITLITLNATDVDNTGRMADTANNRIVIRRSSDYQLLGAVLWDNLSANSPRTRSELYKNGTQLFGGEVSSLATSFAGGAAVVPSVALAAGDEIKLHCYQSSGANQTAYGTASGDATRMTALEVPTW